MLASLQRWSVAGLIILLMAGGMYIMHLGRAFDEMRDERDAAVRARQAAERALVVMADQASENARIANERGKGREAIVASGPEEDGPVAPVLQRGFEAADRIGGIK
jgi:hypothetical protein